MRRRTLLACLGAGCFAWAADDQEAIWRDYIEWYRGCPTSDSDPRASYLEGLRKAGVSDAEIQRTSEIIRSLSRERRDELQRRFFDRTYTDASSRFSTAPNAFLADAVQDLRPGRALDIHMGQGRNAVFLALRGWRVTGFDYSVEGIRAARDAATAAGVDLAALVARHEDFDFGRSRWDLVVMSYTWVPLTSPYVERILDSLAPGGILIFEHLMDESGSQNAAPWLPRPNSLLQVFGSLRVLRYEDARASADWSWRPERIARLMARKPD